MRIFVELSPAGARVDHVQTRRLAEQIVAGRVLDALGPQLSTLSVAARRAYAQAQRRPVARPTETREPVRLRTVATSVAAPEGA